jgi:peptide-methionine (R)-S-oxide reductase
MYEIEKSDAQWKEELSEETYRIARKGGTERPFTGVYWNKKEPGVYRCVCCGAKLFDSEQKYESGSGWPSFWKPLEPQNIEEEQDNSLGMRRTEVRCSKCGAHLGHVFEDGPEPTGLRYCINSASLKFKERE